MRRVSQLANEFAVSTNHDQGDDGALFLLLRSQSPRWLSEQFPIRTNVTDPNPTFATAITPIPHLSLTSILNGMLSTPERDFK